MIFTLFSRSLSLASRFSSSCNLSWCCFRRFSAKSWSLIWQLSRSYLCRGRAWQKWRRNFAFHVLWVNHRQLMVLLHRPKNQNHPVNKSITTISKWSSHQFSILIESYKEIPSKRLKHFSLFSFRWSRRLLVDLLHLQELYHQCRLHIACFLNLLLLSFLDPKLPRKNWKSFLKLFK